jgi:hypothetical protein
MKVSTTGTVVMAGGAPGGGSPEAAQPLGMAGATSDGRAEVATPPPDAAGSRSHPALAAVAEALGLPADEVRAGLVGGRTLAQMAGAQGVDPQTVVDALAAAMGADAPAAGASAAPAPVADPAPAGAPGVGAPDDMAGLVGMTAEGLHEAEASGRTLAEIAEANGVDRRTVIDALVARSARRLSELSRLTGD